MLSESHPFPNARFWVAGGARPLRPVAVRLVRMSGDEPLGWFLRRYMAAPCFSIRFFALIIWPIALSEFSYCCSSQFFSSSP